MHRACAHTHAMKIRTYQVLCTSPRVNMRNILTGMKGNAKNRLEFVLGSCGTFVVAEVSSLSMLTYLFTLSLDLMRSSQNTK